MDDLESRLKSNVRLTSTKVPPSPTSIARGVAQRRARRRHAGAVVGVAAFVAVVGVAGAVAMGGIGTSVGPDVDQPLASAGPAPDPCPPRPPGDGSVTTTVVPSPDAPADPVMAWWQALPAVAHQVFGDRFAGMRSSANGDQVLVKRFGGMPLTCGGVPVIPVDRSLSELLAERDRIEGLRAALKTAGFELHYLGVDPGINLVVLTVVPDSADAVRYMLESEGVVRLPASDEPAVRALIGEGPFRFVDGRGDYSLGPEG